MHRAPRCRLRQRPHRRDREHHVAANSEAVTTLNSTVTDLKNNATGVAQTISDTKKDIPDRMDSPMALRYKGVTITPVAFFAFETVYRSRSHRFST